MQRKDYSKLGDQALSSAECFVPIHEPQLGQEELELEQQIDRLRQYKIQEEQAKLRQQQQQKEKESPKIQGVVQRPPRNQRNQVPKDLLINVQSRVSVEKAPEKQLERVYSREKPARKVNRQLSMPRPPQESVELPAAGQMNLGKGIKYRDQNGTIESKHQDTPISMQQLLSKNDGTKIRLSKDQYARMLKNKTSAQLQAKKKQVDQKDEQKEIKSKEINRKEEEQVNKKEEEKKKSNYREQYQQRRQMHEGRKGKVAERKEEKEERDTQIRVVNKEGLQYLLE